MLDASYDQDTEVFPDTVDVYLQKETKGVSTWRRLTNSKEVMPDLHAVGKKSKSAEESGKASSRYNDVREQTITYIACDAICFTFHIF